MIPLCQVSYMPVLTKTLSGTVISLLYILPIHFTNIAWSPTISWALFLMLKIQQWEDRESHYFDAAGILASTGNARVFWQILSTVKNTTGDMTLPEGSFRLMFEMAFLRRWAIKSEWRKEKPLQIWKHVPQALKEAQALSICRAAGQPLCL